jgi:PAS domain S-box-containing protein
MANENGIVQSVNDRFTNVTGYLNDEMKGQSCSILQQNIKSDKNDTSNSLIKKYIKTKSSCTLYLSFENISKQGYFFTFYIKIKALFKNNNIIGYISYQKAIRRLSIYKDLTNPEIPNKKTTQSQKMENDELIKIILPAFYIK